MPSPRMTGCRQPSGRPFSGNKYNYITWTKYAKFHSKVLGFSSAFVSDPAQYIPVGELDTENQVLVGRGFSLELVHKHALVSNFLSTDLRAKSDKIIL